MDSDKFSSISDLYKRLLPALNAKVVELKRENIKYIDALDIWNYCIENIWKRKSDLRIYELADDILNADGLKIELYTRKNIMDYKNKLRNDDNER